LPRVRLIEERDQASASQTEAFDHIAASRGGRMIRPFAAMLHRPEIARAAADLGAVIRFASTLSDHDRELVIVTTAIERDCAFEWESHRPLAADAGVSPGTLEAVVSRSEVTDDSDAGIVSFVRSLCRSGRVDDETFERMSARFGEEGVVELAAIVGYYSMLALFMSACEAC
jgi:4-carboxymuconolactone decarboxylase